MDVTIHRFQVIPGERCTKALQWSFKQAKTAIREKWLLNDGTATTHCLCRPVIKNQNIDAAKWTPKEAEEWMKVLETASKDARARVVQMHFQVVSTLADALPCYIHCSKFHQVPCAAVAPHALEDDEYDRSWVYDAGAGRCIICRKHLTAKQRRRIYDVEDMTHVTAAGTANVGQAVQCNIPYLGARECLVTGDCPPPMSVSEDVNSFNCVFVYSKATGPYVALADFTAIYFDD